MNHSILTASRTTHLKIVALALVAAVSVVGVGISARVAPKGDVAGAGAIAKLGVVKANKATTFTAREGVAIR
jgi:hypothetical protein